MQDWISGVLPLQIPELQDLGSLGRYAVVVARCATKNILNGFRPMPEQTSISMTLNFCTDPTFRVDEHSMIGVLFKSRSL